MVIYYGPFSNVKSLPRVHIENTATHQEIQLLLQHAKQGNKGNSEKFQATVPTNNDYCNLQRKEEMLPNIYKKNK